MLVLGIETSSAIGGFALVDRAKPVVEIVADMSGSHVEKSIDLVRHLLNQAGLGIADIDAVAVSLGPGSFTGLRVGLSLAKGICFGRTTKLVGIPTLDTIAESLKPCDGKILVIRDARCNEVFFCFYAAEGQMIRRLTEYQALSPSSVIATAESIGTRDLIIVGDGLKSYLNEFECLVPKGARMAPQSLWLPRPAILASIGASKIAEGKTADIDSIEPLYVRPSEAERRFGPVCLFDSKE